MLFNSYAFWGFLVVLILLYRWSNHRVQNTVLLLASYFFYGCWDWRFIPLIALITGINFITGIGIDNHRGNRRRQKFYLSISIITSLGILGFFKYWGFFIESTATLLTTFGLQPHLPVAGGRGAPRRLGDADDRALRLLGDPVRLRAGRHHGCRVAEACRRA